jgi:DNA-binding beta-propeller fold protein YncE
MSSKIIRWHGIPVRVWIALIAALTGPDVLIGGLPPRAAWAQVQEEVFVTNFLGHSVTIYSRTANGNVAPLRIISGPATGLQNPSGLAVDTVNNQILVANIRSITVYSLMACGNAIPLRSISGSLTELAQPIGLAVDTVNDEVLVANEASITVYGRTANGNVAPKRIISGSATGLRNPAGLAVDTVNNEIVVANTSFITDPDNPSSITVYNRTDTGNVAPKRTISGALTKLAQPIGLAVDTVKDEVLVTNESSITVYSRTAKDNIAPKRTIEGTLTQLAHPLGLGLDAVYNRVLVANFDSNAVMVYRPAGGNRAPLRVISGTATELNGPAFPVAAATFPSVLSVFDLDFSGNTYSACFRDLVRGNEITAGWDLGGTGQTSLNVQGSSGSTPTTWLTVYDATPASADPGPIFGAQTLCADVLTVPFNNVKGAGVVALLNEGVGKKGLALVIYEAGNTDTLFLATVDGDPAKKGKLKTLASVSLDEGIKGRRWYRLIMTVDPAIPRVTGKVFEHKTRTDPNSALGAQVGSTLEYHPAALPAGVTSPGENGIVASSINAVLNTSVTNFSNDAKHCGP